jgi:hypothetical protein
MNKLPKEYPFIHIYAQQKAHQPVIIKGNVEGLSMLLNAIVSAMAYTERNGMAEIFDGKAEFYEVIVKLVKTHEEFAPLPYKQEQ